MFGCTSGGARLWPELQTAEGRFAFTASLGLAITPSASSHEGSARRAQLRHRCSSRSLHRGRNGTWEEPKSREQEVRSYSPSLMPGWRIRGSRGSRAEAFLRDPHRDPAGSLFCGPDGRTCARRDELSVEGWHRRSAAFVRHVRRLLLSASLF